jgi:hypothetical protein
MRIAEGYLFCDVLSGGRLGREEVTTVATNLRATTGICTMVNHEARTNQDLKDMAIFSGALCGLQISVAFPSSDENN